MQVTREDLNPCTVKLTVVCAPEQVKEGFSRAYKQASKRLKVPGFRPGTAPRHIVEKNVAKEAINEMAAQNIIENAVKASLKEQDLKPADSPAVELTALSEEEAKCEFNVKVPLPAKVELGEYKGLEIDAPSVEVTDAEVESQLEELRGTKKTQETVTHRGIQEGDLVVLNIRAEGDAADGRTFMIIAGQTFKELDGAIAGMSMEEMKSLDLSFPKSFQEKDWAGKKMHCHITVRSVSTVKAPELDDSFAKSFKSDNLDELKTRLRAQMEAAKKEAVRDFINEKLLDQIIQGSTIHVPDTMWESVTNRKLQDTANEQAQQGKSLEDYAKENGMTLQEYIEAQKTEAKLHVNRATIVQEIGVKEKLQISNNDLNRELLEMSREYQIHPQELLTILRKNRALQDLQFRAIYRRVTDFLNEQAKIKTSKK